MCPAWRSPSHQPTTPFSNSDRFACVIRLFAARRTRARSRCARRPATRSRHPSPRPCPLRKRTGRCHQRWLQQPRIPDARTFHHKCRSSRSTPPRRFASGAWPATIPHENEHGGRAGPDDTAHSGRSCTSSSCRISPLLGASPNYGQKDSSASRTCPSRTFPGRVRCLSSRVSPGAHAPHAHTCMTTRVCNGSSPKTRRSLS
mmetsp:Transcript_93860/g.271305  ORF Transcript_93860/g.271305 Transcript_93860/m.271305 type:complete len:202 (-) Transcript_93860:427-1032(-)